MTRENKLSIVIAFGLLIFVGMLVADHLSIASHREVADLGSNVSTPPLLSPTVLLDGPPPPNYPKFRPNPVGDTKHVVTSGETLRSICLDFYGDSGLASSVASWNNVRNPNAIENGSIISLPTRSALISGSMRISSSESSMQIISIKNDIPPSLAMGTYTVQQGDTLSEIAQKVMGTMKKTHILIDANKDVMPNPDSIRPGMILQFPIQPS